MPAAAEIHSEAWKESPGAFCSKAFIAQHTAENQEAYLLKEVQDGKQFFMLIRQKPVGIVSVRDSLIENLYALPSEQHRGRGTELPRISGS